MIEFLFLGTGGSMGIPMIGCECAVCKSTDPHNTRTRPSGLLSVDGKKILIDASQDYRQQALKHGISEIDGFVLTHPHHDHTAGVDDLRIYTRDKTLPCLLSKETAEDMVSRYGYIFRPKKNVGLVTKVEMQILEDDFGVVDFLGEKVTYFSYFQTGMKVTGIRVGDFAYVTDIREYEEKIFEYLDGVKTLVVSALRYLPNPMHFSVDEAVDFSKRVGAEKTYLTHIAHELEHEHANAYLPPNVRMAYDGLSICQS